MKTYLIAPCGMNCGICKGYLREKNKCPGCRLLSIDIPVSIRRCRIKYCDFFKSGKEKFCYKCESFPCARLKQLDKRYREKYSMSMLKNLEYIQDRGVREFIKKEKKKYERGDKVICVHDKRLY
ncbi:DUF3795 domain-containing protein [Candidatus Falkowbacteria bacterium]|nr:MAG: DUF3795 domain-containing protein [Candidatus Falkowbacteria bacterium]